MVQTFSYLYRKSIFLLSFNEMWPKFSLTVPSRQFFLDHSVTPKERRLLHLRFIMTLWGKNITYSQLNISMTQCFCHSILNRVLSLFEGCTNHFNWSKGAVNLKGEKTWDPLFAVSLEISDRIKKNKFMLRQMPPFLNLTNTLMNRQLKEINDLVF